MARIKSGLLIIIAILLFMVCKLISIDNQLNEYEPVTLEVEPIKAEPITVKIVIETEKEEKADEPIATVTEVVKDYTDEDLYYLAHTIIGEGEGTSKLERALIGSVVINRVNHKGFPSSIKDVCLSKLGGIQYACWWDGNAKKDPTEEDTEIAIWLLENGSIIPANVIYQAQFIQGSKIYCKIGKHYFCYQ